MRKNFTQLISNVSRTKSFVIALTSLMILAGSMYLMAAVGVTLTGGGAFPVSADLAANATLTTPGYTTVGTIAIQEEVSGDFASSGNIVLRAPVGWRFRGSGVTPAVSLFNDTGNSSISVGSATYSADGSTITIPLVVSGVNKREQIIISGVQVQAVDGSNMPGTGSIRVEVANGAVISGLPTTLSHSISQKAGSVKQLSFITQPSDVLLGEPITPAVQVQARDQFGNIVLTPSISLALGSNPSGGNLSGGTSSITNGIVTFSGYSINRVGNGYTLSASSAGAPSVTSNTFTVNNKKPAIISVSGCLSAGDPATIVTITGTNFVVGATVLVDGQSRAATVSNSTTLTTSLTAAELASAINLSIIVKNPAPAQDNGESEAFSKAVIALQPAGTISGVDEVCPGESDIEFSVPTNSDVTSYQWTVVSGDATIASGGNTRTAHINFGNTAGTVQVSVVAFNTCGKSGPATTHTITIKPTPVITVSAQNDNTAVCQGESVVLTAAGANSYVWSGTDIAAGTTGSTLTVTPSVTTTYTVIGTTDNCPSAPKSITIEVTPALTQQDIAGTAEYCHNAQATALTVVTSGGGSTTKSYKWEQSATGNEGTWTQVATTESYTPLTNVVGSTFYRRTVSAGECALTTSNFEVVVKSNPTIEVSADANAICQGEAVELTASGADSYIWSGTGIPAASTGPKVTVTPTATTTYTVIGVTNGCQSAPQPITITVTPALTQGTVTGNTQYCQTAGGTGTALTSTVSGGVTAKSYRWEQSASADGPWEDALGTNNAPSYTPSVATAGTVYYRRVVESGSCTSYGSPVAVTVTPSITNTITSDNQVVCSGETIAQIIGTVTGGKPGEVSYQWEQSANGTTGWENAPGASSALNYTPEAEVLTTSKTTYYRRKVISGNCTSFSEPVSVRIVAMPIAKILDGPNDYFCPPALSTLTAEEDPDYSYTWFRVAEEGSDVQVGTDQNTYTTNVEGSYYVVVRGENGCTSTSAPTQVKSTIMYTNIISGAQTICYNTVPSTLQGEESKSDLGIVTYEWQVSVDGTNFSKINNSNVQNLNLNTALTADRWYRRIARVGSGCSITSSPIKVTVKPLLRVTNLPGTTPAICNNTAYTFTPEGSEGSKTISWTRAAVQGISNDAASGTGGINETLVNTLTAPVNVTYVYTTSDDEGCTGPAQNLVVRVNPTPVLSSLLTPPAICGGTEFEYIANSATAGTTYTWVRKPAAGITTAAPESGNGARVEHVLTNTTADPIDVTYTYTLTANGCSNTQDVIVTVNPRPQLSSTLTPPAICSGATFSYTPASETDGTTFSWTRVAATGITSADPTSGTGNISQALVNTTVNPINVTYRVTTSANGCAGTTESVVVTVNPSPKLSTLLTGSVCSGSTFSYEPASATPGATFSWTRAASGGNTASSGAGNIDEVLTNSTTAPITVTYEITTRANGCSGEPQQLVVTVNPRPVLSSALTQTVCSGSAFTYTPASATTGATYTWTRAAVPGISNAAVTNGTGSVNETLVNTTANPIDVIYVYTTTANGCAGNSTQNLVVTVNPRPQLSSTLIPAAICSGTSFSYEPASATEGATFSWTRAAVTNISNPAVTTPVAGAVNENLVNTGTAPVTVTYRYTTTYASNGSSCAGTVQEVKVVVNPSPKLSSLLATSVCSGTPLSYTPASATTGTTFTWERLPATGITSDGAVSGSGPINQTLTNNTSNFINVTFRITSSANGCTGLTEDVVVQVNPKPVATFAAKIGTADAGSTIYSDGGNVTFTPTGATGGAFSVVSPAGLSGFTTSGSTATLNPCTALGEETSRQVTIRYTVSQGSGGNACSNFEDITYTLRRSNYTVIVLADPYPTCRGQVTEYTAYVYKDVTRIIYPYLADANGIAVDLNGNKLGDQTLPITNPDYPFPNKESMPKILYDNAWRYFQPKVEGGTLMPASNFNYQWTKNRTNFFGANAPTIQNAGLSSLDYYAVEVTSKNSNCAQPITSKMTNRMYTSATVNYEVALKTDKAVICQGEGITMTADLNDAFSFWGDISLTLYWMLDRGGVVSQLGQTEYKSGDNIQFPTPGPAGGFLDGDKVFIEFSSALDQYNNANKCARGFITNVVPITVVGAQTVNGGGAFCQGGVGVPVSLAGSQQNVFYQLKRDGQPVGSPVAGTGSALSFGNQTVAGAYTVEALANTAVASCLTFGPVNVYVTPQPVAHTLTAANNGEYCAGGNGVAITLGGSQSDVRYQLQRTVNGSTANVGEEVMGTGQPIVFPNQTVAGEYSVLATTVAQDGTVAACPLPMGKATIIINPIPTVAVNSPSTCAGTPVEVAATPIVGTAPFNYTWTVPAGATNPGNTSSFTTMVPGTYTVTVTDAKSCAMSAPVSTTVVVKELPTVTVNSVTMCANDDPTTIEAVASNGSGNYSYAWTVPNGVVNPGNVASFATKVEGQYTVLVTDNESCTSEPVVGTVTVTPMKTTVAKITAENANGPIEEPTNPIGINEPVTFTVSMLPNVNQADIIGYRWSVGSLASDIWAVKQTSSSNKFEMTPTTTEPFDVKAEVLTVGSACYIPIVAFTEQPIIPLPVELLYFNATKRGSDVVLDWATASELDNKGFEVQVSSDAKNFRALSFVESKVNTTSLKQVYSFVDKEKGKQGVRYYRLKQVDLDGKFEIFNIKAVHFDEVSMNKVKAYPNPFHSEVELSIDAELDGELQITVTTATGQQLLQRSVQVARGTNIEKLTLDPDLPRGVYIISTRMGDFNSHFKLLKQ
ncbi:PKD-like domain-containing protein [Pontibacter ramchanderi]|uniref:PKD domain-containing protein n=1 Tax=Pontibacter ramchanderi TaxID=1179743 RepID=A0A2N3UA83_9BACT|nr:PKD-like domain-containing protein [Pontibacter ramchanderi]PKV66310.1 hypothetical protein BD749_1435 [Pontibacter ramchanderi]